MCDIGDGFQWIGYVVKEATAAVHDTTARNDITGLNMRVTGFVVGLGCCEHYKKRSMAFFRCEGQKYTMT